MKSLYFLFSVFMLFSSGRATAQEKQVVVWDGETATKGSGWVTSNGECTVKTQTTVAYSGKSAVQFTFKSNTVASESDWIGAGWNWVNWQVGPYGTDITSMQYFTFWLKVEGVAAEMQFNLLCNGAPALDMPEHHTTKVKVSKYCPEWKDGQWNQVIVPLKDLIQPKGFDPEHVAEMQFFNTGNGDGSFFIDDLTFIDSAGTTSIQNPLQTGTGNSIIVFPNPVNNYFTVKYNLDELSPLEFVLYDVKGILIVKQKMDNLQSQSGEFNWKLNDNLASGKYFIVFHQKGIKVATFKLILS